MFSISIFFPLQLSVSCPIVETSLISTIPFVLLAISHSFKNTIELARYISEYKEEAYTYESSKVE